MTGCSAPKSDVDAFGFEPGAGGRAARALLRAIDYLFDFSLELIDARSHVAFGRTGSCFQPKIVDLREDAILAGHPAITKLFPGVLGADRARLLAHRGEQLTNCAIERRKRVIVEFGNIVSQSKFSASYLTTKDTKEHKGASRPIPS